MAIELASPRLRLRRLMLDDVDFIVAITRDPDWVKYIGDRDVNNAEQAGSYINNTHNSFMQKGFGLWVVEVVDPPSHTDRRIGLCGLVSRDFLAYPDIGFAFLPHGRGHGYATEAVNTVLKWVSEQQLSLRISAIAHKDNLPSVNVLKNTGFQDVGHLYKGNDPIHILFVRKI